MCGRYTVSDPQQMVEELALTPPPPDLPDVPLVARYNVAPTQQVPIVRQDRDGGRHLVMVKWGLVPFWSKDVSIGNKLINARAETITEKASFKHAFKSRRCWILSDGFYEWKKIGGAKQPFHIHLSGRRPFVFAGLWERWDKEEPAIESCTILTTSANERIAEVHDRMPVILDRASRAAWIDPKTPADVLGSLLRPFPPDDLELTPVSRLVNSPGNDLARCLEPVVL